MFTEYVNDSETQYWNGHFFERTSLKALRLRIQLGHEPGDPCVNPSYCADDDFVVLDLNGIHKVGINLCGCTKAQDLPRQLLCARLFPATVEQPKTAVTFNCMEFFHILTFESKASMFEFHNTLSRLMDNFGGHDVPVSLSSVEEFCNG